MPFQKGHKGFVTAEGYKRASEKRRGVPLSEERKKKLSIAMKKNGWTPPLQTGKKRSNEIRERLRKSHLGHTPSNKGVKRPEITGDKHPKWKGGISSHYRRKNAPREMPEKCEICGVLGSTLTKGLCLDHDHKTGKFRGWLCYGCNASLGMLKEDINVLLAMIKYINDTK